MRESDSDRRLLCWQFRLFFYRQLKAVAKKLHKVDVDVKLLHSSQDSEHGEFLIQEKNKAKYKEDTTADDIDVILSNGRFPSNQIDMMASHLSRWMTFLFFVHNDVHCSTEPKISSQLFCRAFPFHVLFDRNLSIKQVGNSLKRILPASTRSDCKITDILRMVSTNLLGPIVSNHSYLSESQSIQARLTIEMADRSCRERVTSGRLSLFKTLKVDHLIIFLVENWIFLERLW